MNKIFFLSGYEIKDEFLENNTPYIVGYITLVSPVGVTIKTFFECPENIFAPNDLTYILINKLYFDDKIEDFKLLEENTFIAGVLFLSIDKSKQEHTVQIGDVGLLIDSEKEDILKNFRLPSASIYISLEKEIKGFLGRIDSFRGSSSLESLLILQAEQEGRTMTMAQAKEIAKDWHFGGIR